MLEQQHKHGAEPQQHTGHLIRVAAAVVVAVEQMETAAAAAAAVSRIEAVDAAGLAVSSARRNWENKSLEYHCGSFCGEVCPLLETQHTQ